MFKTTLLAVLVLAVAFAMPLAGANVKYDRATETTLDTTVLYVGDSPSGAFVIVKDRATGSGQNEVIVRLAPGPFLESEGLQISTRDAVKIVGSRITADGAEVLVAREVTHKGKTFVLRDAEGTPRW